MRDLEHGLHTPGTKREVPPVRPAVEDPTAGTQSHAIQNVQLNSLPLLMVRLLRPAAMQGETSETPQHQLEKNAARAHHNQQFEFSKPTPWQLKSDFQGLRMSSPNPQLNKRLEL